eukprot:GEMP01032317.1.p1 GENE.GEMP01032317.1~~GEMP01032317.1.p1  ORF type:complete len:324 (+),score=58.14 GEMP01032317.1:25-972(+)
MAQSQSNYTGAQSEARGVTQYSAAASEARSKLTSFNKIELAPSQRAGPPMARFQPQSTMSGMSPRNMPTLRYPVGSLSPTGNRLPLGLLPPARISGNRSPTGQFTRVPALMPVPGSHHVNNVYDGAHGAIMQSASPISQGFFPQSRGNQSLVGSPTGGTQQNYFDAGVEEDGPTIVNQYQYIFITERDPGPGHRPQDPILGTCWGRNPHTTTVASHGQRASQPQIVGRSPLPVNAALPPGPAHRAPQSAAMMAPAPMHFRPTAGSPSMRSVPTYMPRPPHSTAIMTPMLLGNRASNGTITTPTGTSGKSPTFCRT